MQTIFEAFDQDKDGFIDKSEIEVISKELGHPLTKQKIDKIFKKMDINKDGKLSFDEFKEWWIHGKSNGLEALIFQKF